MQPIHRTSCQGTGPSASVSLAGYLARLIDGQAQARTALAAGGRGPDAAGDANALIWVEDDAAPEQAAPRNAAPRNAAPGGDAPGDPKHGPGLPGPRARRMIVAAHGPGQAMAERSFIISYPVGANGGGQRIPAVSAMLAGMGWSVLAFRRWRTALGRTSTAVLVNTARPGGEQRLWLAEPPVPSRRAPAVRTAAIPAQAGPGRPCRAVLRLRMPSAIRRSGASRSFHGMRQLEARANEAGPACGTGGGGMGGGRTGRGGAGDDLLP